MDDDEAPTVGQRRATLALEDQLSGVADEAVDLAYQLEYVLQGDEAGHRTVGEFERRAPQLLLHMGLALEGGCLHQLVRLRQSLRFCRTSQ